LEREQSGKWKGRSEAEVCTSEVRKIGEAACARGWGSAPLGFFLVLFLEDSEHQNIKTNNISGPARCRDQTRV
jgi:hypothetical protein